MSDAPKKSSGKFIALRTMRSLPTSQLDYLTMLLKAGLPPDIAEYTNNFWVRLGMTRILVGPKYYTLRTFEEV